MRLLLDTHIMLAFLRTDASKRYPDIARLVANPETQGFVSVASLWETAIKARLGKLDPGMPLADMVESLAQIGLHLLQIKVGHVITSADPEPKTRDPFDRLLLAQCEVEGLQLAAVDGALTGHRLALQI